MVPLQDQQMPDKGQLLTMVNSPPLKLAESIRMGWKMDQELECSCAFLVVLKSTVATLSAVAADESDLTGQQ